MKAWIWAISGVLLAISSTSVAGDVLVSHYEPLQQLSMRTVTSSAANASQKPMADGPVEMRFEALGRSFELQLQPNQRLLENARIEAPLDGIEIYRGEVSGAPGSWARIVVHEGMPRGLIFDGRDLIAIEAPGDSLVATDAPVIYRLADTIIAPGSMTCGSQSFARSGAAVANELLAELGDLMQGPGAVSEIEMGVVGDYEFTTSKGGDSPAAAAITTRLNNVDGYFSAQLGVQISVQVIDTFGTINDPFTDVTAATDLLDELSNWRSTNPAQNSNGLTHLYTGRDLDGSTVGIAWSGALCSNFFGAGLSEGNGSSTFDSLIAAHEIGHNFGAPHDGEAGSPCVAETGDFLMSPTLNGSSTFLSCSITEMSDNISSAACITPLPTVDMEVTMSSAPTVLFGANADVSYDVRNNGTLDATNVTADFTLPVNLTVNMATAAGGTCTSGAGTVSCAMGDVPGLATRAVSISVTPASLGPGNITATVTADVDERAANNQETLQLNVDPAVDLVVGTPTGATIKLNKSTTITATLENRATIDATGVTLIVDLGNALQATAANWGLGSCTVLAQQVTCQAASFAAQSNSSISVTATGISAGNPNINVVMSSLEADLVPGNNNAAGRVQVNDPDDDSGSGSSGPVFLLLLAGLIAARRRRGQTL